MDKKSICNWLEDFYFEQFNADFQNMYDIINYVEHWDFEKGSGRDLLLSFFKEEIVYNFDKEEILLMRNKKSSDMIELLDDKSFSKILDFLYNKK